MQGTPVYKEALIKIKNFNTGFPIPVLNFEYWILVSILVADDYCVLINFFKNTGAKLQYVQYVSVSHSKTSKLSVRSFGIESSNLGGGGGGRWLNESSYLLLLVE